MPATKTAKAAKPNRYAKMSYFHLLREAEKPIADRRELPIGRNDENAVLRRFHIPSEEIAQLKTAHNEGDKFPNPHNSGCYHYVIEALKSLGLNQAHAWPEFRAEVKRLMSKVKETDEKGNVVTLWDRFESKPSKSENGRDVDGRLQQNCEVLQRLSGKTPYGYRINQIAQEVLDKPGACIDIIVREVPNSKGVKLSKRFIRLNVNPTMVKIDLPRGESVSLPVPLNQTKRRKRVEEVEQAVKEVRKVVRARKPKAETEEVAKVSVEPTLNSEAEPVGAAAE